MLSYTGDLADNLRITIAAFQATSPGTKIYVLLTGVVWRPAYAADGTEAKSERVGPRAIVVRRLYSGKHKELSGVANAVVGHDLLAPDKPLVAIAQYNWAEWRLEVVGFPPSGLDVPFDGLFDIKQMSLPPMR